MNLKMLSWGSLPNKSPSILDASCWIVGIYWLNVEAFLLAKVAVMAVRRDWIFLLCSVHTMNCGLCQVSMRLCLLKDWKMIRDLQPVFPVENVPGSVRRILIFRRRWKILLRESAKCQDGLMNVKNEKPWQSRTDRKNIISEYPPVIIRLQNINRKSKTQRNSMLLYTQLPYTCGMAA